MKGTGSILQWARQHSLEETMEILSRGKILIFNSQRLSSTDPTFFTLLNMAYVYWSIEEERMLKDVRYVGYDSGFTPNKDAGVVRWILECAADGMELEEIVHLLNQAGIKDKNRRRFTVLNSSRVCL